MRKNSFLLLHKLPEWNIFPKIRSFMQNSLIFCAKYENVFSLLLCYCDLCSGSLIIRRRDMHGAPNTVEDSIKELEQQYFQRSILKLQKGCAKVAKYQKLQQLPRNSVTNGTCQKCENIKTNAVKRRFRKCFVATKYYVIT